MQNPGGGMGPGETRNLIIAIVLTVAIFAGFEFFYNKPNREHLEAQQRAQAELQAAQQPSTTSTDSADGDTSSAPVATETAPVSRTDALGEASGRIVVDTGEVDGSISLQGARIDDLNLRHYRRTIDPTSNEVTLLSPINTEYGHDAFFGWELQTGETSRPLADVRSGWTLTEGATLTPTTPVTLSFDAGDGLTIERRISIDDHFMFTITDTVRNTGAAAQSTRPFATVRRAGVPQDYKFIQIVHQGMVGVAGPRQYRAVTFRAADKHARDRTRDRVGEDQRIEDMQGTGGWFGVTDHYWLAALVPDQAERVSAYYDSRTRDGRNDYLASYRGQWREVPAGGEVTYSQRFFAGAKSYELLRDYQAGNPARNEAAIPRFDDAIDWGNFWFLTRPFFAMLHWFGQMFAGWGIVFNFGLAILASTVVIKALMFPLVYQSFKSMAKMRGMQPKMKEIQERYAADKQRQQQEILKLYQTEKINPVAGCVPILFQIPVFYALYKTLTVTIEMRHEPFVGWIHDLSARDHTSLFNLFGLLPYEISPTLLGGALLIGAWPIFYGISMWALQALSPPPTDPVQAQIFRFLPILFTFMFAAFPAGLVIYWTWSNTLSILQQYVIMRRQGVETQLDRFLKKRFGKDDDPSGGGQKREAAVTK
ncbi:MAG: membrane protein insertase YidC [Hyphomonadaceae bacterium]|nr:membrane protein insertase YidC [Hyphomonadaceae bacterium]